MTERGETLELAVVNAPFGSVAALQSARGLVSVIVNRDDAAAAAQREIDWMGARIRTVTAARVPAAVQLREYLAGRRRRFTLRLDLGELAPFSRRVLNELAKVPYGCTVSYGGLAARAGCPGAARAVGGVMHRNRLPIVLPCHRVIAANGGLGGYSLGLDIKRWLFEREGIPIP